VGRLVGIVAACGSITALQGCGLEAPSFPGFSGPSTHALSLVMTASPDAVLADGKSTAIVVATLRGPDGRGVSGREIVLRQLDATWQEAEVGRLSSRRLVTGVDGRASAVFHAPGPEQFNAHSFVTIQGRIVRDDAVSQTTAENWDYYGVTIELLPNDLHRYPEAGGNVLPFCNFVTEPRFGFFYVGVPIRFQSTSYDPDGFIVRYEWRFGDGSAYEYAPDVYHTFWYAAKFFPALSVRDNGGLIESCNKEFNVIPAP